MPKYSTKRSDSGGENKKPYCLQNPPRGGVGWGGTEMLGVGRGRHLVSNWGKIVYIFLSFSQCLALHIASFGLLKFFF